MYVISFYQRLFINLYMPAERMQTIYRAHRNYANYYKAQR